MLKSNSLLKDKEILIKEQIKGDNFLLTLK